MKFALEEKRKERIHLEGWSGSRSRFMETKKELIKC
jgi:hypothetical protein